MPTDKTLITEVVTGLGSFGEANIEPMLLCFPSEFVGVSEPEQERLHNLWFEPELRPAFHSAFSNGQALFEATDGLNRRRPNIIEWTGGRNTPGDEQVPADLRIDHVYLISCKYLSKVLHNASPARVFDHALARGPIVDRRNWYSRVCPDAHRALYKACVTGLGFWSFPDDPDDMTKPQRRDISQALKTGGKGWPSFAIDAYERLCHEASQATAELWRETLDPADHERLVWRLLRIGSAPYFVLGSSKAGTMRLRVATPWDLRQVAQFLEFEFEPDGTGQPKLRWAARFKLAESPASTGAGRSSGAAGQSSAGGEVVVRGHIELRWSHGRFSGPPEAKIYLDTPHGRVPGYFPL
jgi:hypothetical protein